MRPAQRHLDDGSTDVNGLLDQSVAELGTAVAEIRQIAHGLRPSSLDDGLGPALAALTTTVPVAALTQRERQVLALMAEGRTNVGIARRLWLTERTVETHISNILTKLSLDATEEDHRRVLAVLAYLGTRSG